MLMMKTILVALLPTWSPRNQILVGEDLERLGPGMLNVHLLYALVVALSSLLSPSESDHPLTHDRSSSLGLNASPSRAGRDIPDMLTDPGPVVLSNNATELDDEVEIPDEPEDDEPDDPGFAFPSTSRSFHAIRFITAPEMTRPAAAVPSHVAEGTPAGPDQPLFMKFCRFLI
jgi:hypothetical protein